MKQEEWIRQLHDKLANHQVEAPEGLWADIEAKLQNQAKPVPARFVSWHRWAAAASLLIVLSGAGIWWLFQSDGNEVITQTSLKKVAEPLQKQTDGATDLLAQVGPTEVWLNKEQSVTEKKQNNTDAIETAQVSSVERVDAEPVADEYKSLSEPVVTDKPANETKQSDPQPKLVEKERTVEQELDRQIARMATRNKRHVNVALFSNNGIGTQTSSNGVLMNYNPGSMRLSPIYLVDYKEEQKHHVPVSLGLQVSYPFTDRLSLSAGIVFTWLHSEFDYWTYGELTRRKQKLYYQGVSLNLDWHLWKYRKLDVYCGAGVQTDWNVSANVETEGVEQDADRDRLQWSLGGRVGMQYNLSQRFGIYLEPSLKYYFDNGSKVKNYFKDKPANFSLQFGLRLRLKTEE
ncbi:MAG: outer membrane beta-barrel protein [Prevotella sp.]|nr:outer membrane beta-barrel protein [Prevotella sp.]